jgi:hypothetical protein
MKSKGYLLLAALALALGACQSPNTPPMYLSGMLGANAIGNDELDFDHNPPDGSDEPDTDVDTTITGVIVGQKPLLGNEVMNVGFEVGASLSWWADGISWYGYSGSGGAVVVIDIDNSMWLGELFLGPYMSVVIADSVRLYVGAGGVLAYAGVDYETTETDPDGYEYREDEWDYDFSWGLYARGGLEIRMDKDKFFGLGVRWMKTDFDLDDLGASFDLETIQALASFTVLF